MLFSRSLLVLIVFAAAASATGPIEFTVGSTKYTGRVDGQTIRGTSADGKPWTAKR